MIFRRSCLLPTLVGTLFFASLCGSATADRLSGPGRVTVLANRWGTLYCPAGAKVTRTPGDRFTIENGAHKIHVSPSGAWLLIQFPNQTARLRRTELPTGEEVLVQFGNKNYYLTRTTGQIEWRFPDDHIWFKTMDGNVRDVIGNSGALKIRRNFHKGTYEVSAQERLTQLSVHATGQKRHSQRTYKIVKVQGDPASSYPYLIKGVCFEQEGVGFFLPLPGRLPAALDWSLVTKFETVAPVAAVKPREEVNSQADAGPTADDPLNLRLRMNPGPSRSDVLKANTGRDPKVLDIQPPANNDGSTPKP